MSTLSVPTIFQDGPQPPTGPEACCTGDKDITCQHRVGKATNIKVLQFDMAEDNIPKFETEFTGHVWQNAHDLKGDAVFEAYVGQDSLKWESFVKGTETEDSPKYCDPPQHRGRATVKEVKEVKGQRLVRNEWKVYVVADMRLFVIQEQWQGNQEFEAAIADHCRVKSRTGIFSKRS